MSEIDQMPKRFRNIKQEFTKIFREMTSERARSMTCIDYVNENMGFALSKLYINKYMDNNARSEVGSERLMIHLIVFHCLSGGGNDEEYSTCIH